MRMLKTLFGVIVSLDRMNVGCILFLNKLCIWMHEGGTMAGHFVYIENWEAEEDDSYRPSGYYGRTHGCGCCSTDEGPLTLDDLKQHLESLLSEAKSTAEIINKMEVTNEADS
jgi:hypothetical protein